MPNLTLGKVRAIGAVVDVAVGLILPEEDSLLIAGLPPLLPIFVKALIDTGAARTLIDLSVVKELGLVPLGDVDLTTVSTGRQPVVALTCRSA